MNWKFILNKISQTLNQNTYFEMKFGIDILI